MTITIDGSSGIASVDGSAGSPSVRGSDANSGIVYSADNVAFSTAGTSRANIDSSGDLNVEAGNLNVSKPAIPTILVQNSTDTSYSTVKLQQSSGSGGYFAITKLGTNSSAIGGAKTMRIASSAITFKAPDGGNRYFFGEMGDSASAELSLYDSSDSQKVRISAHSSDATFFNATSNVLINSTSISGSSGRVYTNRGSSDSTTLEVNQNAGGSTEMITFRKDGTQLGTIHQSGSGVAYQSASDYRLKQDDVVISDGITRVKQLRPIRFKWKSDTDKTVDGFFAHEVSPVVPESVRGNKDEVFDTDGVGTQEKGNPKYQQLDQSKLVPLLTAALQEAITKIETLETKVAALEAA